MGFDRFLIAPSDVNFGIINNIVNYTKAYMNKLRKDVIDITNKKFGRLTVLKLVRNIKDSRRILWRCKCDCGRYIETRATPLTKGRRTSCGCRGFRRNFPSPVHSLYCAYIGKARKRKIYFYLSERVFSELISKNCFYCGVEPKQKIKLNKHILIYNGVDRIDPSGDYTEKNCVTCCKNCNFAKSDLTLEEFKNHIKRIALCLSIGF